MPKLEDILDINYFAPNFLKIEAENQAGGKSLVPLRFNKAQQYYVANREHRNIIVKARQIGMSTGILGRNFHSLVTQPMTTLAMITHKDEVSNYLSGMITRFRENMPFPVETGIDSAEHLQIIFKDPPRSSDVYMGTAGARIWGRAMAFTKVHMTEVAHWAPEKIQEILAGVMNAVPNDGDIDIESTPKGRSGWFYDTYQAAKRKEEPYRTFFFPWWWCERYRLPKDHQLVVEGDRDLTLSPEEKELVKYHGLNHDQIRWRRWKWREQDRIQKDLFRQEFPEDDVSCWLVAGLAAFDQKAISDMMQSIIQPLETEDFLTIWKRPVPLRSYIVGVDTGEGLPFGDYSVGFVMDISTGENVATLRGRIPSDVFAEMLAKLAHRYNDAFIAVERPKGEAVILMLAKAGYTNLYVHRDTGSGNKAGFPMSRYTRNDVIDALGNALRNRELITSDTIFLNECMDFQMIDGKRQAPPGKYDDSIFAAALAVYLREYAPQFLRRSADESISDRYV